MKKSYFIIFFIVTGYATYFLLPQKWKDSVERKAMLPYYAYYARNLDNDLSKKKEQMRTFHNNSSVYGNQALIAHTGGIGEFSFKSSVESIQDSLEKGFRLIEVDLYQTCDGHLIATHTWEELAQHMGLSVLQIKNMPLKELKKQKICGKYTILCDSDIRRFMNKYPDMILVTDRIQDMDLLKEKLYFPERSIVEISSKYAYAKALRLGFRYPAMTTGNDNLDTVEKLGIPIIVVDAQLLLSPHSAEKIKHLHQNNVTIMVWNNTICDEEDFIRKYLGKYCSMIYTNRWSPTTPPSADEN